MHRKQTPFTQTWKQRPIPFELDGTFEWLSDAKTHKIHIGVPSKRRLPSQLKHAIASAVMHQWVLPDIFIEFCQSHLRQSYFRSATDCYLDLGRNVLPLADGFLIRFLADSQGCAFWYLYMQPGTQDHAVVNSTKFFDADDQDSSDLSKMTQRDFVYDSPSLESFLCQFWLENEIFFAQDEGTDPPKVGKRFLKLYSIYNDVFE